MARRLWLVCLLVAAANGLPGQGSALGAGEQPGRSYVRDLRQSLGQTVTVRGRTGVIRETPASDGCNVYTLRDDYGYLVDVHIKPSEDYPIMGATYDISGQVGQDSVSQALYLEASSQKKVYGGPDPVVIKETVSTTRVETPAWLLPLVVGLIVLGAVVVALIVRRMLRRRGGGAGLSAPWGYVEVVSGPHQGMRVALRDDTTAVGRHLDPVKEVTLDNDRNISRRHGAIIREGDAVYYVDTNSTNGSSVNEQPVASGQRMPISPGALIRVGPNTVLRVEHPEAGDVTRGPQAENTGEWGDAETARSPDPRLT